MTGGVASDKAARKCLPRSADLQSISISGNRSISRRFLVHTQNAIPLQRFNAFNVLFSLVAAWPRCAVSPICNRQGVETIRSLSNSSQPAECNSAIQQIQNLRYDAKRVRPSSGAATGQLSISAQFSGVGLRSCVAEPEDGRTPPGCLVDGDRGMRWLQGWTGIPSSCAARNKFDARRLFGHRSD